MSGGCRRSYDENLSLRDLLIEQKRQLISRRQFLRQSLGGSAMLFFGLPVAADNAPIADEDPFVTLEQVLEHLLPSEADAPGAKAIKALDYFRFIVTDPKVDAEERELILNGVGWLNGLALERQKASFNALDTTQREAILRQVASSRTGEWWIATLLLYLFEALLAAPAYGVNPDGIGWQWLEHTPGYPLPDTDKIYPRLSA